MAILGRALGAIRGLAVLAVVVSVVVASGCDDAAQCPGPNPGLCAPTPTCIDGFRRTGAATCENGEWVCGRVACVPDAGACDGACPGSGAN